MKEVPEASPIEVTYSGVGARVYKDNPEWAEYKKNIIAYLHETNPDVRDQIKKSLVEHNEPQHEIKSYDFDMPSISDRYGRGASIDWCCILGYKNIPHFKCK